MKELKNYSKYLVTKDGDVISKRLNKKIKPFKAGEKGYEYMTVILVDDFGKRKNWRLNRLIWSTFVGDIPNKYDIHHIDDNKENNKLSNLQCLTRSDNCFLRKRKDCSKYGRGIQKRGDSYRVIIFKKGHKPFRATFSSLEYAVFARDKYINSLKQ